MGVAGGGFHWNQLSGTVISSARSSLLKMRLLASVVVVVVMAGCVSGMDVGKGGVYDSPMAQDYYVKRFGFMFGGGRSGMYGLVAHKKEVKPAVQMRNSVDTYYRNVLPTSYSSSSSYTFNRLRSKPLLRAKPMVKLAPKKMGSTYFNTFMAVP